MFYKYWYVYENQNPSLSPLHSLNQNSISPTLSNMVATAYMGLSELKLNNVNIFNSVSQSH